MDAGKTKAAGDEQCDTPARQTPAEVRAELDFEAAAVCAADPSLLGPAALAGVDSDGLLPEAERYRRLGGFDLRRPGERCHRLVLLLGPSEPRGKAPTVRWRLAGGRWHEQALVAGSPPVLVIVPAGCDHDWEGDDRPKETLHLCLPPGVLRGLGHAGELPPAERCADRSLAGLLAGLDGMLATPAGPEMVAHVAAAAAVRLARPTPRPAPTPARAAGRGPLDAADVDRVMAYLREHNDRPVPNAELAALVGLCVRHFTRSFKAAVARTPQDCGRAARLDAAEAMLRGDGDPAASGVPCKAAAAACGFSDESHLSRLLLRERGLRPSDLRGAGATP